MEFKWRIFLVALILTLALSALSGASLFLFRGYSPSPTALIWFTFGTTLASFLISPILVFACFYLLGRRIDLKAELLSVIVSLFLGSWIGHLIGYFSLQFIYVATLGSIFEGSELLWYMWFVFQSAFSLEFFAGFSALSMAYIVTQRALKPAV